MVCPKVENKTWADDQLNDPPERQFALIDWARKSKIIEQFNLRNGHWRPAQMRHEACIIAWARGRISWFGVRRALEIAEPSSNVLLYSTLLTRVEILWWFCFSYYAEFAQCESVMFDRHSKAISATIALACDILSKFDAARMAGVPYHVPWKSDCSMDFWT
jgi:hypothetical protein